MRSVLNTTPVAIKMLYVSVEQWMGFISSIKWQLLVIIIVAAFYRELRELIKRITGITFGNLGITSEPPIVYVPDTSETLVGYAVQNLPRPRETTVVDDIPTI